jgi:HJR/Mrr/RecB family endonuclease
MMGVLQTFPKGAKGVIVTSSELTEGSRSLALANGIQFIENVDFIKGIET